MGAKRGSNEERFYRFVEVPIDRDCHLWHGAKDREGCGVFRVNEGCGASRMYRAHRWIYQETFGRIDDGVDVRRKCGCINCVNPFHLEVKA